MENRRRDPRVKLPCPMMYRPAGSSACAWFDGTLLDFSAGGLRFLGEQLLEPHEMLAVQMQFPLGADPYDFTGRIIWVRPSTSGLYEYGAQLNDLTLDQAAALEEIVRFLRWSDGS